MKMYEKKELEYKGGYLVAGDKVVGLDNSLVHMLNGLEEDYQFAKFMHTKEMLTLPSPTIEFRRKSEHGKIVPTIEVETPELDAAAEKSVKMMDELDAVSSAAIANEYLEKIMPLIMFVEDEFVVSVDQPSQDRLDLLCVGNPLELTKEKLVEMVTEMFM